MQVVWLVLLGILAAGEAEAACTGASPTWTSTPDQASVNTCVASASRGDTINVSSGSATWSGLTSITKGLSLIGGNGGTTTITAANGSNFILEYTPAVPANDDPFRVSGFTFNTAGSGYVLHFWETNAVEQHNMRVDHNIFMNGSFGIRYFLNEGPFYGVFDHNTFGGPSAFIENLGVLSGSGNWNNLTFVPGSNKCLYFEDNTWTANDTMFSGGNGGRYCFRYNTINAVSAGHTISPLMDAHGNMGPGGNYGTMGVEIYGNLVQGNTVPFFTWLDFRGGKGLLFNNKTVGTPGTGDADVREEHADTENPPANNPLDGTPQHVNHTYFFQNKTPADVEATMQLNENTGSTPITADVDYFFRKTPFTGASGVGVGTVAQMQAINPGNGQHVGVGFWATTDDPVTMPTTMAGLKALSGVLYRWNGAAWAAYYTPYTYPHPLTLTQFYIHPSGSDGNPGTLAQPWATLAKANSTLTAGQTVNIRTGTYTTAFVAPANSGTVGNPITYQNYNGEVATISNQAFCVHLTGRTYITITGLNCVNDDRQVVLDGGSTNNILDTLSVTAPRSPTADWAGSRIWQNSHHNIVRNSLFDTYGQCTVPPAPPGGSDDGSVMDIGNENTTTDFSDFNLIENNTFTHGGHHVLGVNSNQNVVRNNYFHNEAWSNGRGDRTMYNAASGTTTGQRNLFHGNRYGYAAPPCDANGVSGLLIATANNIFRFNKTYHHDLCGLAFGSYAGVPTNNNRVYHNTFFNNGNTDAFYDDNYHCGIQFNGFASATVGNVIKNNLFYKHKQLYGVNTALTTDQTFANNFNGDTQGDPKFVNASTTPPADKTDKTLPNLDLQAGSPAIDAGGPLTTITTVSGSGTSFTLADASYFMDGWGVPGVTGDVIQLVGTTQTATLTNVNYSTNVITFTPSLTWTQNQGVSLTFSGSAPDAGAVESSAGGVDITPPSAPTGLRVQ